MRIKFISTWCDSGKIIFPVGEEIEIELANAENFIRRGVAIAMPSSDTVDAGKVRRVKK